MTFFQFLERYIIPYPEYALPLVILATVFLGWNMVQVRKACKKLQ